MRYYALQRRWTKRIEAYLGDRRLNAVLVRDFNKFTTGNWNKAYTPGQFPRNFESCDWSWEHCGPEPRYWQFVKHSACHWLVNFNLRLAQLVEPKRAWRIVTSDKHSTVWDGKQTLFEFNSLALGITPNECLALANRKHLPPGKELMVYRPSLRQLGVTEFAARHALGDGASWIWKSVGRVLPGCTRTLDIYHASQRLSGCAQTIFGEGTAEATIAFERGRELLLKDGWSGVCVWVAELLTVEKAEERTRRQKATEKLLGYFAKHTNRLNYRERLASGRAIGSGVVEGQAKTLGLRMKARGARWRKKNVRPMVSLVCVRNSIQWEPTGIWPPDPKRIWMYPAFRDTSFPLGARVGAREDSMSQIPSRRSPRMSSDPNQVGAGVTGAHQVTFAFPTPDPKTFLAVEGVIHVLNGRVVNLSTQDGFFQLNSRDATSLTFTYHTVSTYGNSPAGAEALVWSRANLNRHDVVNGLLQSCELVEDVKLLHRPITVAT